MASIVYVTTVPETMYYGFEELIPYLKEIGFDVVGITSSGQWCKAEKLVLKYGIDIYAIEFTRAITPWKDFKCFIKLFRFLLRKRPDILHFSTPKVSIMAVLAGYIIGIPVRIYTVRGIPYVNLSYVVNFIYHLADKACCLLSHKVIAVSKSNLNYLIEKKICSYKKCVMLCNGSSHGVNALRKFNPYIVDMKQLQSIRKKYKLTEDSFVVGFVGRLAKDKGIDDLLTAWKTFAEDKHDVRLIIIGPYIEPRDNILRQSLKMISTRNDIILLSEIINTSIYYRIFNILIHPSYREGFPNVVLEANAMKVPVITTNAIGCVDSVCDGKNGLCYNVGDIDELIKKMTFLYENEEIRTRMGNFSRKYVLKKFNPMAICKKHLEIYNQLLNKI